METRNPQFAIVEGSLRNDHCEKGHCGRITCGMIIAEWSLWNDHCGKNNKLSKSGFKQLNEMKPNLLNLIMILRKG